jgi:Fe-S-cluster-containing hydrogenase component 2
MGLTRKEFFRQGVLSLGKTALNIAETLKGGITVESQNISLPEVTASPRLDMVAESFNERCLARNCGCFACSERCPSGAIVVIPGQGISVDKAICIGCGTCEYVCPVTPKAVVLVPREQK